MSREPLNRPDDFYTGDLAWMKDDLASLREVPPMQLSNERLRDAILASGLEESKPLASPGVPWWSWAWAPLAAAAIAVVIVPRLRPHATPDIRISPDAVAMNVPELHHRALPPLVVAPPVRDEVADAVGDLALVETMRDELSRPTARSVVNPVVASRGSSSRRVHRRASPAPRLSEADRTPGLVTTGPSGLVALAGGVPSPAPAPSAGAAGLNAHAALETSVAKSSPQTMAGAARVAKRAPEPVVLLAPESDPTTGAAGATEVDSARNVSVGG